MHISLSTCSIDLEALTFNRLAIVQHVIVSCYLAPTNTFVTLSTTLLMYSPNPETKPNITADNAETQTPAPPKKSPSKKKTSSHSTSMKEEVLGSPSRDKSKGKSRNIEQDKDRVKEMRRIALETLFEYGVRGETMNNIAAKVSAICYHNRLPVLSLESSSTVTGLVTQSGLSKQQVGDLFRTKRAHNYRDKIMTMFESGGI